MNDFNNPLESEKFDNKIRSQIIALSKLLTDHSNITTGTIKSLTATIAANQAEMLKMCFKIEQLEREIEKLKKDSVIFRFHNN